MTWSPQHPQHPPVPQIYPPTPWNQPSGAGGQLPDGVIHNGVFYPIDTQPPTGPLWMHQPPPPPPPHIASPIEARMRTWTVVPAAVLVLALVIWLVAPRLAPADPAYGGAVPVPAPPAAVAAAAPITDAPLDSQLLTQLQGWGRQYVLQQYQFPVAVAVGNQSALAWIPGSAPAWRGDVMVTTQIGVDFSTLPATAVRYDAALNQLTLSVPGPTVLATRVDTTPVTDPTLVPATIEQAQAQAAPQICPLATQATTILQQLLQTTTSGQAAQVVIDIAPATCTTP